MQTAVLAVPDSTTEAPRPDPRLARRGLRRVLDRDNRLPRMSSTNGRSNANERGSSYDRRARRAWLLSAKAGFGGNDEKVPCWECGAMVDKRTLVVDRIIPGEEGGTYRRDNIRPHCGPCSCRQGQRRTVEIFSATKSSRNSPWHDAEGRYHGPLAPGVGILASIPEGTCPF